MAKQRSDVQNQLAELLFKEGVTQKQETSFCQAIRDGKLPSVIPDVKRFPAAMALSPKGSRLPTTWPSFTSWASTTDRAGSSEVTGSQALAEADVLIVRCERTSGLSCARRDPGGT